MARTSAARARAYQQLHDEMESLLERDRTFFSYLEPWQRVAVDPTVEHVITIEREDEQAITRRRVTCSCGLDRGWQMPMGATQDASWHRAHVMRTKHEHDLDTIPVALIERKQTPAGALFRWCCDTCPAVGAWLVSEPVAGIGSILHAQACPTTIANAAPTERRS